MTIFATASFTSALAGAPPQGTLAALLLAQAEAAPRAVALIEGEARLTTSDLVDRASRVAAQLIAAGAVNDTVVGLFAEPSAALITGLWGIVLSGAAYLPLAPDYPEERLRLMIEDSRLRIVLCQARFAATVETFAPPGTTVVVIEDALAAGGEDLSRRAPALSGPRDLAYVIYTSGSTGRPKGVMIEQASIVGQLRWLAREHGLVPGQILLQKTPISFDAGQWELLAPALGVTIVVAPPGAHRDPDLLIDLVVSHGVTLLQVVPTLLRALVETERLDRCHTLARVFSGGEALSNGLARATLDALPWASLINLYGPTECTINSSSWRVEPSALSDPAASVSIGRPVADTTYHVLDADRRPVAPGAVGELWIGGAQLARGYLHRPDLTADRFILDPFRPGVADARLYRSGDLVFAAPDGAVQFVGRADDQVKIRGFRIELDEVRLAIEAHDWVKTAVVVAQDDARGDKNLIAYVELSPREAALMDQGRAGAHHQSKASRLQVRAQLSNPGLKRDAELDGLVSIDLPGDQASPAQRRRAFARKTYRFFEGGAAALTEVEALLRPKPVLVAPRAPEGVSLSELGTLLREFGQHHSPERLLPKYAYASPGALYAVQLHLEITGVTGLADGTYYYHPVDHRLVRVAKATSSAPGVTVHLVGRRPAISAVYRSNVQEVLELEAGHLLGLFDDVLGEQGLAIGTPAEHHPVAAALTTSQDDVYLGAFPLTSLGAPAQARHLVAHVQSLDGRLEGLTPGQHRLGADGAFVRVAEGQIERKHVIAINQQVYDRASFGLTLTSDNPQAWLRYIELGRWLQRLQQNGLSLGLMSSGYSSRTSEDLPSARRIAALLGREVGASYFCVGGRLSQSQIDSQGMNEDAVHMQGPAELIAADLRRLLPPYMAPSRLVILDALPLTANGKVDRKALEARRDLLGGTDARPHVAPRTPGEETIEAIWRTALKRDQVSVEDDFFALGGNSLTAVSLIHRINAALGARLKLQALFEAPTIAALARKVEAGEEHQASRAAPLRAHGTGRPVFCWPGLGGYPMNLRALARGLGGERRVFGLQALGINAGEVPHGDIQAMAAADIETLRKIQPSGPYTLWGYSFGARVAFETAYQLEQAGETVEALHLIAPGSPRLDLPATPAGPRYDNPSYQAILFSVYAGALDHPDLAAWQVEVRDDASLAAFVSARFGLDADLAVRIAAIVRATYQFRYSFEELDRRRIAAPVTLIKARGDDYAFIEGVSGYSATPPRVIELDVDHYALLKPDGVAALARALAEPARIVPIPIRVVEEV
ncbi:amino acid adenylation domain-containing protein [Caulobacter soli]|uniref:non-ribosomal peptide synthetase family protein n=1 Tax=Caulobacter soli TaxID=2708539 RepID=UPI0013ECC188|nr:amino acid adenylation domain-containing protein [Caulobacter soli]